MRKTPSQRASAEFLTPPEIAVLLGVSHQKVLDWIDAGELPAVDLSAARQLRPRYKIRRTDYEAFLDRRATTATVPAHRPQTIQGPY